MSTKASDIENTGMVEAPAPVELVEIAGDLADRFREQAIEAERSRHLPSSVAEAYTRAGLIRTLVPRRWGGYELDFLTALDVSIALGHGDGSAAWVCTYWTEHAFLVALFPEGAQAEVWADGPDARVATSFAPRGTVERAEGGYRLSGQWPWCSGIGESSWVILGALVFPEDGAPPHLRLFLVPVSDGTVIDTWHNAGLSATGSDDFLVEDLFVPEHLTCDMSLMRDGTPPGANVNPNPQYSIPFMATELYALTGTALGAARGAVDAWAAFAREKVQSYTGEQVSEGAPLQIRLASMMAELDAAELLMRRGLADVQEAEEVDIELRVRNRRDFTYAMRRIVAAVDDLLQVGGASSLFESSPIQRAWRDVHAISTHVMMNFEAAGQNYGRLVLGHPLNERDPFF